MKHYAVEAGPLWAVTSYFNPVGYRRRRENFHIFREQLQLPLVAVELSFNGRFELQPEDAESLIQIRGRDVMWHKERLLNVAVQSLPVQCTKVALLDCDVVFVRPDWVDAVSRRLESCPLLQPFSTVHYPPPDMALDDPAMLQGDFTRPSVGLLIEQGQSSRDVLFHFTRRGPGVRAPGHAIAARRDWLQEHGLYDANIVGSGDASLLAGALGLYEEVLGYQELNQHQIAHYRAWAEPVFRDVNGEMGCVAGDLVHLWHGDMSNRFTFQRHRDFCRFDFDPVADIAVEAAGCWRWSSDKCEMHDFVRDYFATRKEDGCECPVVERLLLPQLAAA